MAAAYGLPGSRPDGPAWWPRRGGTLPGGYDGNRSECKVLFIVRSTENSGGCEGPFITATPHAAVVTIQP